MQLLSTKKNKLLLLLPTCLVYVVYIILPILVSLYYSFTKYSGISKPRLYGLKNYIRLLDDPYFWIALKNTAIILGISILLLGIGAFFVAMLLNQPMRGVNVCKALIFAPAIIASIIAGVIWGYLLDPVTGLVNNVLRAIGLDKLALEWIGGKTLSPYSIAFVYFLAAGRLYCGYLSCRAQDDSARDDGGGSCRWDKFLAAAAACDDSGAARHVCVGRHPDYHRLDEDF